MKKIIFHAHCGAPIKVRLSRKIVAPLFRKLIEKLGCDFIACSYCASEWNYTIKLNEQKKVKIVYYGIETEKFGLNIENRKQVRAELAGKNCFIVGTVGRFTMQKNPFFLLDVFKHIHDKCPEAKLLWIGDGPLRRDISICIQKYRLADSVILYGLTNDVAELMSAMDAFLLPSLYEGFGIVNIEAQANGLNCFLADSIPSESGMTNLAHFISLDLSADKWAEIILKYRNESGCRDQLDKSVIEQQVIDVRNAGFDISDNVKQINEIYRRWI